MMIAGKNWHNLLKGYTAIQAIIMLVEPVFESSITTCYDGNDFLVTLFALSLYYTDKKSTAKKCYSLRSSCIFYNYISILNKLIF